MRSKSSKSTITHETIADTVRVKPSYQQKRSPFWYYANALASLAHGVENDARGNAGKLTDPQKRRLALIAFAAERLVSVTPYEGAGHGTIIRHTIMLEGARKGFAVLDRREITGGYEDEDRHFHVDDDFTLPEGVTKRDLGLLMEEAAMRAGSDLDTYKFWLARGAGQVKGGVINSAAVRLRIAQGGFNDGGADVAGRGMSDPEDRPA